MVESDVEEFMPLIPISGIPKIVRDTRQTYEKKLALYLILASTVFERIAFYTLAATLALTAETPDCTSSNGPIATFIFTGTSNISTLIFAVISDAKLGRAKTIIVGFCLYLVGYILAIIFTSGPILACTNIPETKTIFEKPCAAWIYPTLIIIAIGAGAVQSNMAVFGAEQIQESKITSRYFYKYVMAVNMGAIFAKFAFYYIETQNYIAYIYAASVLLVATLLFIIGRRYYIHIKPYDSVVTKCIPVTLNALQSWRQHQKNKRSRSKRTVTYSRSKSANVVRNDNVIEGSLNIDQRSSITFLDYAKAANNGKFIDRIVDDVKSLRGAFIVFSLLIPYWLIYDQLNSTFRVQARHMQGSEVHYTLTLMTLGDPVTIIIGILILTMFVYKYLDARNKSLTIVTKFIIGMCFAVVTMFIAGIVEKARQDQWYEVNKVSRLSIHYQIPQGLSMGFSELFVMVASFEYAYFAAPRSAQSLFMSLRFCSIGISSFIGVGYIAAFAAAEPKMDFGCRPDPNMRWPFYTYFFVLGGLQLIFIMIFLICQKKFQIIKFNRQQMETGHFLQHSSISSAARQ